MSELMPMDAQTAVNKLRDHFLGKDYYIVDPVSPMQANAIIVDEIISRYRSDSDTTDTVTISSNDYIKVPVTIPEVAWDGNTYTNTTDTRTISWTDHFKKSVSMPEVTLNGGVDCHIVERYEPVQPSKVRYVPYQPSDTDYNSSPCRVCKSNPKNGGSGFCNCTLGRRIDIQ